jgi:arylsulfatase A-like enzyme/Tfp pilus assembly protein PilF
MKSRRKLAVLLALLLITAVFVLFWAAEGGRSALPSLARTSDQNVLLVTIDTLRADALGSYGGRAATPNLDRLARGGIRFTFAHAHAVVTLPSHASILTGRYPFDHGVRDNAGFRLGMSPRTLAELAREKGLATGAFIGAFPLDRQFGLARGFDVYEDLGGREVAPADFAFAERRADEVVAAARAWIEQQRVPWLAWVHVFDPHSPYVPPSPFDRQYAADPYAGEVAYTDYALGPLLELARRGPRPTLLIVTADHGEGLGDHDEPTHGVFAYESTLRVPLIVVQVGPGIAERQHAATSDVPVGHIDIVPTIADLLGLDVPEDLPGRRLTGAARDRASDGRVTYFEAMTPMLKRGWSPLRGVIAGRDKYIDLPIEELYDLAADPREERNLAPSSHAKAQAVAARLNAFGPTMPGEQTLETAAARARLQSLGYVSASAARKAAYGEEDDPKRLIDVDRLMIEGIDLHRAGRSGAAMEAYLRVIARRPDMGLAYRRLAYIQWESGAAATAIATLRQALDRNGPDKDIEVRLATYLAETGAVAESTAILERVVRTSPDDIEVLNALGIAYGHGGRPIDAQRTFERILELDPKNAFALENLGAVHLQRRDFRAAGDAFARAAKNDPRSSRAQAGLGIVALHAGRRDEAISFWRHAVELDSRNYDALYNLATELVKAGRRAEARPFLEQFAVSAPLALYGPDVKRVQRLLGSRE